MTSQENPIDQEIKSAWEGTFLGILTYAKRFGHDPREVTIRHQVDTIEFDHPLLSTIFTIFPDKSGMKPSIVCLTLQYDQTLVGVFAAEAQWDGDNPLITRFTFLENENLLYQIYIQVLNRTGGWLEQPDEFTV